jgi:succinate-acetate transporter protein
MLFMALLCLIYLVCALRTNIVFVVIFLGLFMVFAFLTGFHWEHAAGNDALGDRLCVVAGAWGLVACAAGWYIFVSQMLQALDFPFELPVGDLSRFVKGASEKRGKKDPAYQV